MKIKCKICGKIIDQYGVCICEQYWFDIDNEANKIWECISIAGQYYSLYFIIDYPKKNGRIEKLIAGGYDESDIVEDLGIIDKLTPKMAKQILEKLKLLEKFV